MLINKIIITSILFKSVCSFSMNDNLTAFQKSQQDLPLALERGDLEAIMEFYEEEAKVKYKGHSDKVKKQAIRSDLAQLFVRYGYLELLKKLNLSSREIEDFYYDRLIRVAAKNNHLHIVKYLFNRGANVLYFIDKKSMQDYSPEIRNWARKVRRTSCALI